MRILRRALGALLAGVALFAAAPATSPLAAAPAAAATRFADARALPHADEGLRLFATESAARRHCPDDEVVWLNTASGIYHEAGMRWYGATRRGAYVCRREADAAGDRDTRNGQ